MCFSGQTVKEILRRTATLIGVGDCCASTNTRAWWMQYAYVGSVERETPRDCMHGHDDIAGGDFLES
jgi:hypothetical protein